MTPVGTDYHGPDSLPPRPVAHRAGRRRFGVQFRRKFRFVFLTAADFVILFSVGGLSSNRLTSLIRGAYLSDGGPVPALKRKGGPEMERDILHETANMYLYRTGGRLEIRLNGTGTTHAVCVGVASSVESGKRTMNRLERYPKQLRRFCNHN